MSLENIQLPSIIITELYKKNLVQLEESPVKIKVTEGKSVKFLGGNNQHILLLVKNSNAVFLTETQLKFLTEVLGACKFTMNDVAVINLITAQLNYKQLEEELNAKTIILFGLSPSELELPFNIPEFQKQSYNNKVYLLVPSLDVLQNDKDLKRKLWTSLQQIFSL